MFIHIECIFKGFCVQIPKHILEKPAVLASFGIINGKGDKGCHSFSVKGLEYTMETRFNSNEIKGFWQLPLLGVSRKRGVKGSLKVPLRQRFWQVLKLC